MQLPRPGDTAHPTPSDAGLSSDACSLTLSGLGYCNALLHSSPASTINKFQWVLYNADRIVLQSPRRSDAIPLLCRSHWLPVKQKIVYKTAVLTFKVWIAATPAYLSCHLQTRHSARHLRSSGTPLLSRTSTRTDFAARGFRHSAPAAWNSLSRTVLDSSSLAVFKSTRWTKKNPPYDFCWYYSNAWEFLYEILHDC